MKTERIFLAEWLGDYTDGYNDIPWPMVHEWVGQDCLRWINGQNYHQCQLILEKDPDPLRSGIQKLYVEFYDPRLRTEFAIRFAK